MMEDPAKANHQLGRYRLVTTLGQGGMGTIWLAVAGGLGEFRKLLVVKELRWDLTRNPRFVEMFLDEAGVIVGPIQDAADLVVDPQLQARGMLVEHFDERVGEDVLGPGVVPTFSATPGSVRWAGPPRPGHHNAEVYGEIGLGADELGTLAADGVI